MKHILYKAFFLFIIGFSVHGYSFNLHLDEVIDSELLNSNDERLKHIKQLLNDEKTEEALVNLYDFIGDVVQKKDTFLIIESHKLLADILRENGDYVKSNIYFSKIIPLIKNDLKSLQYVYFKKGGNFQIEGEVDSALVNYEKAIEISHFIENDEDNKAKIHANLSGIYYLKENYKRAIEHSKIAANYQRTLGNKDIEAGILNNLGGIYYMQGNYQEALETFQQAFEIVGYGQSELQKRTRNSTYINLAYAYSGLNDFKKAFEFQDRFFSLNDSLQQELKYKEIAEIESKYNVANKEKEAEIEKSKRLKAEYISVGLGLSTSILLLGLFILYKLFRLSKKNYELKINQKQLIHQSKIEKIKSESQSKILLATLDGALEERKKIASVLHDNVSALLSAANLHLYASKNQLKENVPEEIEKTQKIISEASEKIRDLSHNLISAVLLKFGLEAAVQDLCEKSSNSTLQFVCKSKNIERFNQNFEMKIFGIITELVNNIIKHSEAKNATVKLEQLNGNLQVIVFDDGKGYDINAEYGNKNGLGLSKTEITIKALDGLFEINATSGTRIFISVPIQY